MTKDQKGQTSIEYILLLTVSFSLAYTFFGKLEEYVITNPDSFLNLYLNDFKKTLTNGNGSGTDFDYKRFPLRR
jgi:hypothetical protein